MDPRSHVRLPDEPDHFIEFEIMDYTRTPEERARRVPVYASHDQLDHFVTEGWMLCEGALTPDRVDRLRAALDRAIAVERDNPDPSAFGRSGLTVRWLLHKAPEFVELMQLTRPLSVARAVLGPQVQLGCFQGRVVQAGEVGKEIPWHIHHRVVPKPLPAFFAYPHAVHCLFYLDDVAEDSGAITLLPRSHLAIHDLHGPLDTSEKPDQMDLFPKAGDCLLIHGNLWHKVKPSRPEGPIRRMITCGYLPSWIRLDAVVGIKPTGEPLDLDVSDPDLAELFGAFNWR